MENCERPQTMGAGAQMKLFSMILQTRDDGAYRRLRRLLKTALRRDQLRCVDAKEIHNSPAKPVIPAPAQAQNTEK